MRSSPFIRRFPTYATYAAVTLALTLAILWVIPANDVIMTPGSAEPLCSIVHVQGQSCQASGGGLYDTYVNESNGDHLLQVMMALVGSHDTILPAAQANLGCPQAQYQTEVMQMMAGSKVEAEASALHAAGFPVKTQHWGPQIIEVACGTPAASKLVEGDRILAVDGHDINGRTSGGHDIPCPPNQLGPGCSLFQQIHELVDLHPPGTSVAMTVLRGGKVKHLSVQTVGVDAAGALVPTNQLSKPGVHPLIGITMSFPFKLPVKIHINTGDVGGPSAGLAFALGIYQQLTHQDLTRGNRVAVTGEINYAQLPNSTKLDGIVGEIGGAQQKAVAAQAAGAKYFLVPRANYADALSAHTSLIIHPVQTLSQAISFLKSLPTVQTKTG